MANIRLKWENIAKNNFLDPAFSDWLQINKGYTYFLISKFPLTEDSYRAQAALLNALLKYYLDTYTTKYFDKKKIDLYLMQFDTLVAQSSILEKTSTLNYLQTLIKCVLYYRIGDYLMSLYKLQNKEKYLVDDKYLVYSLCSYVFALEHILSDHSNIKINDKYQIGSLNTIELYIILKKNFELNKNIYKSVLATMSDKELPLLLMKRSLVNNNNTLNNETSFIANDVLNRTKSKWVLPNINMEKNFLNVISLLVSHPCYLRRLLWIYSLYPLLLQSFFFENNNLFMKVNNFYDQLDFPKVLSEFNIQNFFDYLLTDFNISYVCMLDNVNNSSLKNVIFPWILFSKVSVQNLEIWKIILCLLSQQRFFLNKNAIIFILFSLFLNQAIILTNHIENIIYKNKEQSFLRSKNNQNKKDVEKNEVFVEKIEKCFEQTKGDDSVLIENSLEVEKLKAKINFLHEKSEYISKLCYRVSKSNKLLTKVIYDSQN